MEIYTIEAILLVFLILITCAVIFCALRLGSHLPPGDRGSEYGTEYACHTDLYLAQ